MVQIFLAQSSVIFLLLLQLEYTQKGVRDIFLKVIKFTWDFQIVDNIMISNIVAPSCTDNDDSTS